MNKTSGVRRFFEYLPEIIKFHKLKNEGLARLIFVLVFFCQLVANFVEYKIIHSIATNDIKLMYSYLTMSASPSGTTEQISEHTITVLLILLALEIVVKLVSNLFFSVYMYSYIAERRGKDGGIKASFKGTFRNFGRLVCYNIVFCLLVLIGGIFFIVPGIIAYSIFVFGYCYLLDLRLNVADAMTASSDIIKGKRTQIISLMIGYVLIFKLPIFLFLTGDSLGVTCVISFFTIITGMILQRLISQVYLDLEYGREIKAKK